MPRAKLILWLGVWTGLLAALIVGSTEPVLAIFFYLIAIVASFYVAFQRQWVGAGLALCIFAAVKVGMLIMLDPLAGPDELRYFEIILPYPDFSGFMSGLPEYVQILRRDPLARSAYPFFAIIYVPLYAAIGTTDPRILLILNSTLALGSTVLAWDISKKMFPDAPPLLHKAVAFGLLISPVVAYHSAIFAKDLAVLFIGLLAAKLTVDRRWVAALLLTIYVTGLRPYAIAHIIPFVALAVWPTTILAALAAGAAAIALLLSDFDAAVILNGAILVPYMLVSPDPTNFSNYQGYMAFLTFEGLIGGLGLLVSVAVFVLRPASRYTYLRVVMGLAIYAFALATVGYFAVLDDTSRTFAVGVLGDNMVRKKLPIVPLIYFYLGFTFFHAAMSVSRRPPTSSRGTKQIRDAGVVA